VNFLAHSFQSATSHGIRCGFVGFGRKTFDTATATRYLKDSGTFLRQQCADVVVIEDLITDVADIPKIALQLKAQIDVLIAQFTTFVDARFIDELTQSLDIPVIVWAIREPNQGVRQRLALNSLTGANLASHMLTQRGKTFHFLYGNPDEQKVAERLQSILRYIDVFHRVKTFTVVTLGDAPDGFHFSSPQPQTTAQLGIRIVHLDLNDVFQRALNIADELVFDDIEAVRKQVRGLEHLPQDTVLRFAKLQQLLRHEIQELGAHAVAVRCWPEFFTEFGAAACSTVSALIEQGVMASCEADVLGALSMDIVGRLADSPAFLGDLVELDEETGAMTFWHCGAGAFSLARPEEGAVAGLHPNRNIGFTLEFGLRPGRVTVFRLGEGAEGQVRALVGLGTVLDEPQRFLGTSGRIVLDGEEDALDRLTRIMEVGFEPHYAIAYGDVTTFLRKLCGQLGIPVTTF